MSDLTIQPYIPVDWASQFSDVQYLAWSGVANPVLNDMLNNPLGNITEQTTTNTGAPAGTLPTWGGVYGGGFGGTITYPGANGVPTQQQGFSSDNIPSAAGQLGPATDIKQLAIAVGILAGITLALPEKYGVWVPWLVLLGYGATHTATVNTILTNAANTVGGLKV